MNNFKNCIFCYSFVFFSILLTRGFAQEAMPGPCKEVVQVSSFEFKKFLGDWYEIARSPRDFEDNKTCMESHIAFINCEVVVSRLYVGIDDNEKYNNTGKIEFNKRAGEGVTPDGYRFVFLDIVYDKYSVAYGCTETDENGDEYQTHKEIIIINTREKLPDANTFTKALEVLQKNGIDSNALIKVNRPKCPDNFDGAKNV